MRCLTTTVITVMCLFFMVVPATAQSTATCDSFSNQAAAQLALSDENADELDPDGDRLACESLPESNSPFDTNQDEEDSNDEDSVSAVLTDQEQEYFDALVQDTEQIGEAGGEIGTLFQDAADDPTVIFDEEWSFDLAAQFFIWQQVGVEAQTLDPSLRQQHIHDLWLEINRLTTLAVDDYIIFIDEIDAEAAARASARVNYAAMLTDDLTAAVEAFEQNPDAPIEPAGIIAPVADCEAFDTYEEAQEYYPAHPEEQATIDPDFDGFACEVHFGR